MTPDPSVLPEIIPATVSIVLAIAGVASLDTIGFITIGILLVLAMGSGQKSLISIALIAGLILFLGTVAFAIYLERRAGE